MVDALDRIENKQVRNWYENNINPSVLNYTVDSSEEKGYKLDPRSGLLIRNVYTDKTIKNLGHTIVDIIFPRPVDLHHHEDIDEALYIIDGKGEGRIIIQTHHIQTYPTKGIKIEEITLCSGKELYIPKGFSHTFRPEKDNFLEIRLACSGILDSKKEICERKFDEYEPWVEYYKKFI